MARKPAAAQPQPRANRERGEYALTLGDVEYRLRPSFEANVAIEEQLGKSLLELAVSGRGVSMTMHEAAVIATAWIRAGAEDELTQHVGFEGIGPLIYARGLAQVAGTLSLVLAQAVTGGRDAEGNVKAATGKN